MPPIWTPIDDADPAVSYSAGWVILRGSSRQWESAVHSTSQQGASATFRFYGTAVSVFGTIPIGPGVALSEYRLDGTAPVSVSRQSQSSAVYADLFFHAEDLRDGMHTIVVSNTGTEADFQLDRFEYLPSDNTPLPPPIPAATPLASPSPPQQALTSEGAPTPSPARTSSDTNSAFLSRKSAASSALTSSGRTSSTGTVSLTSTTGSLGPTTVVKVLALDTNTVMATTDSFGDVTVQTDVSQPTAPQNHELNKGVLVGVIVSALILFFFLLAVIFLVIHRSRSNRKETDAPFARELFARDSQSGAGSLTPFAFANQTSSVFKGLASRKGARPFTTLGDSEFGDSSSFSAPEMTVLESPGGATGGSSPGVLNDKPPVSSGTSRNAAEVADSASGAFNTPHWNLDNQEAPPTYDATVAVQNYVEPRGARFHT